MPKMEIDGKHYFWCGWCQKYIDATKPHDCLKNKPDSKRVYPGSL